MMGRPGKILPVAWLTLLTAATVAVYWSCLDNPFVYDDLPVLRDNAYIQDSRHLHRFWRGHVTSSGAFAGHVRPIPMISFHLNFRVSGLDPAPYRAVNLLLHLLCSVLVFSFVRRVLRTFSAGPRPGPTQGSSTLAALIAATLFALHPIHSLSMLLVWKRTTLLAALFYLVAALAFMRLRGMGGPPPRRAAGKAACAAGVFVSFVLAMLSKETAITLPAALLLLSCWPRRRPAAGESDAATQAPPGEAPAADWRRRAGAAALHLPLWIIAALWLTCFFPHAPDEAAIPGAWPYLMAQARAIWFYAASIFAPNLLAVAYDARLPSGLSDLSVLAGGAAVLSLAGAAVVLRRRLALPGLAVLWILITLSPTSSFVPGWLLVDEDRTYLPFILVWALAGVGVAWCLRGGRPRRVAAAAAAAAIVAAALFTVSRCVTWSQEVWTWLDALKKYPDSAVARVGLCTSLSALPAEATRAEASCRRALAARPGSRLARAGLIRSLINQGKLTGARSMVDRLLAGAPRDLALLRMRGHLAWHRDDLEDAARFYRRALAVAPLDVEASLYLARTLLDQGRTSAARGVFRQIQDQALASLPAREIHAGLQVAVGDPAAARRALNQLRRELPRSPGPLLGLARLARARGDRPASRELLKRAATLAAEDPALRFQVARASVDLGLPALATRILVRLSGERPADARVRLALALALLADGDRGQACMHFSRITPPAAGRGAARLAAACAARSPPPE